MVSPPGIRLVTKPGSTGLPLFVYGTLRSGEAQAGLLGNARRREAYTWGKLFRLPAGYPALSPGAGADRVYGELVTLPSEGMLITLDLYEGVDEGLFRRQKLEIGIGVHRVPAWAYVMDHPERRGGRLIPSGRWRRIRSRDF